MIRKNSILLGTALCLPLATATFAQSTDGAVLATCDDLRAILDVGTPDGLPYTDDEIVAVIVADDVTQCEIFYSEIQIATGMATDSADVDATVGAVVADTQTTTVTLSDEVTIVGRVLLDQAAPQVDIDSPAADVTVQPGAAIVRISQSPGEIVVRQAPANVTIDMPTPTITITQAAPEIIVRMPDPGVAVGAAEPTVEVRQAQPVVTVRQSPPQVDLELRRAEEGEEGGIAVADARTGAEYMPGMAVDATAMEDAVINLNAQEPVITLNEATEQAQVTYERSDPVILFEQTDPVVSFTGGGEPQIEFVQSGEPTVTFLAAGDAMPAAMSDEQDVGSDDAMAMQTDSSMIERDGYGVITSGDIDASTLVGMRVYGMNDEDMGEIGNLIIGDDGTVGEAVIDFGGFLGMGETNVAYPFDQMTFLRSDDGDVRIYVAATDDDLRAMPVYEE